jgi:hypothetical protein
VKKIITASAAADYKGMALHSLVFRQSMQCASNQIGNETHQGLGAGAGKEERPHVLQEPGLVSAWTDKQ